MTTQTQTQAEQIAARYDHDGRRGVDEIGEACMQAGARRDPVEPGVVVGRIVRYTFRDGSMISVQERCCWDLGAMSTED